jgi:hypothetical protein
MRPGPLFGFVAGACFGVGVVGMFWCFGDLPVEVLPLGSFAFGVIGFALALEISSRRKP